MKRIGAVSPAARQISRMTFVRMSPNELGRMIVRMVCHWVAPKFQHVFRKEWGTAFKASREAVIITGSVMTAMVSDAVKRPACHLLPGFRGSATIRFSAGSRPRTNAPNPNRACTMLGTPARVVTVMLIKRFSQQRRRRIAGIDHRLARGHESVAVEDVDRNFVKRFGFGVAFAAGFKRGERIDTGHEICFFRIDHGSE